MKAVYTKSIEIIFYLKNGVEKKTGSDYVNGRYCYNYEEVPSDNGDIVDIYGELTEEAEKKLNHFSCIHGVYTSRFSKRKYFVVETFMDDEKVYIDEIEFVTIKEKHKIIDNPKIEWLEKDLGFKGYSELVFDREQELKAMLLQK